MKKPQKKRSSLEHEVIVAVTVLYLLISGAILAIHFLARTGDDGMTQGAAQAAVPVAADAPAAPPKPAPPVRNRGKH